MRAFAKNSGKRLRFLESKSARIGKIKANEPHRKPLILLADDEESVREVVCQMLDRLGFTVELAANGCEALELFKRDRDRIVFVLMDLSMPLMDGRETLRCMNRIKANVPVILSSGYNRKEALTGLEDCLPVGFIQKPYALKDLKIEMARVLATC